MILERMRDEKNFMCVKDYNLIAFDLREDAALVKSVVEDFGLFVFTEDGKYFYSKSFLDRMQKKQTVSERRAKSGTCGAKAKWKNGRKTDGDCEGSDGDAEKAGEGCAETKLQTELFPGDGNEKTAQQADDSHIDEEKFVEFFNYYIKYYKSKISPIRRITDARSELLANLLAKGYTKGDMIKVIAMAAASQKLNGKGSGSIIPDFDWIFYEKNFIRILEGSYNNKT